MRAAQTDGERKPHIDQAVFSCRTASIVTDAMANVSNGTTRRSSLKDASQPDTLVARHAPCRTRQHPSSPSSHEGASQPDTSVAHHTRAPCRPQQHPSSPSSHKGASQPDTQLRAVQDAMVNMSEKPGKQPLASDTSANAPRGPDLDYHQNKHRGAN